MTESDQAFVLEADLGMPNGIKKFRNKEDIQAFISEQLSSWKWLSAPPVSGELNTPWSTINSQINAINGQMPRAVDGESSSFNGVKNALEGAFRNHRIPVTDSPVFQFIKTQKDESAITAAAALSIWMNLGGINYNKFDHLKGAMLMASFDAGITSKTPTSVKRSLELLQQKYTDAIALSESQAIAQREDFLKSQKDQQASFVKGFRRGVRKAIKFQNRRDLAATDSIKSLTDTERLYKEQMGIKAPVEYWSTKARTHNTNSKLYRKYLLIYAGIGGIVLLVFLACLAIYAIKVASTDKPSAVYIILATIGLVVTTMSFWAARILTRLFLSEHHLAIDADERAVMAQTYLALTAEGQASESERGIVLTSLFRPTADGIVKDDAAPDMSPAGLISKAISR